MKLIITEEERSRILGMHQNATSKQYLVEQETFQMVLTLLYEINPQTNKKQYRDVVRYSIPQMSKGFAGSGAQTVQSKETSQTDTTISKIDFIRFENGGIAIKPLNQTLKGGNITGTIDTQQNPNLKNILLKNINKKYLGDILFNNNIQKNTQYAIGEQQLQSSQPTKA